MNKHGMREFIPLAIAVLTISDTRDEQSDKSGNYLIEAIKGSGHIFKTKIITKDNLYQIRAHVSQWIADDEVQAVVTTGGTGFGQRDVTPEAIQPLFDKEITGFGEYFRALSIEQVGTSTIQSRALAGVANNTFIFSLPGSSNACKLGWEQILQPQLDHTHDPCNFVELMPNLLS